MPHPDGMVSRPMIPEGTAEDPTQIGVESLGPTLLEKRVRSSVQTGWIQLNCWVIRQEYKMKSLKKKRYQSGVSKGEEREKIRKLRTRKTWKWRKKHFKRSIQTKITNFVSNKRKGEGGEAAGGRTGEGREENDPNLGNSRKRLRKLNNLEDMELPKTKTTTSGAETHIEDLGH